MFAATGSTITAAIPRGSAPKYRSTASRELKRPIQVRAANASGTPALSGTPRVIAPEPARTSKASLWPW